MTHWHAYLCVYSGFGGYTFQKDPEITHELTYLCDYTLVGSEGTHFVEEGRQHMGHSAVFRLDGYITYTER